MKEYPPAGRNGCYKQVLNIPIKKRTQGGGTNSLIILYLSQLIL